MKTFRLFTILKAFGLLLLSAAAAQAATTLSLTPASQTLPSTGTVSVQIRMNSTDQVNAAEITLHFPSALLDVTAGDIDGTGSAFAIQAEHTVGTVDANTGFIRIARGNIANLTGNQLIATVTFRGKTAGSASVSFNNSKVLRSLDQFNTVTGTTGGTYTLTSPDTTAPTLSNIAHTVFRTSATVTFTTNEGASRVIDYGLTTSYGSSVSAAGFVTSHSQNITGLTAGTTYNYRIRATDAAGNTVTGANRTFVTLPSPDTTAPVVSNISVSAISQTGATINFNTNEMADGVVEYGLTTSYGLSNTHGMMMTSHAHALTGLTAGTTYNYRIRATDAAGNASAFTANQTFVTAASTIPAGSASMSLVPSTLTVSSTATFSVAVRVNTNGVATNAAQFELIYPANRLNVVSVSGTGSAYGIEAENTTSPGLIRMARGSLTNVTGDQLVATINFQATSAGVANVVFVSSKSAVMQSAGSINILQTTNGGSYTLTSTATADTTPPVISGVSASNISSTTARINWTTNEAADSLVEFGLSTAYGLSSSTDTAMVTSHVTNLAGLTPNTVYNYRVRSRDAAGNRTFSANGTFTTAAAPGDTTPPVITNVSATNISSVTARINWTTNENADGLVEFGLTTAYGSSSSTDTALGTSHVMNLAGLTPSTMYHYRVRSRDAAGNVTFSGDNMFTTNAAPAGDTTPPVISGVSVSGIGQTGATINFTTNEPASRLVEYGPTTSYGFSASNAGLNTSHAQALTGLTPGTTYNYRLRATDGANNASAFTANGTFVTARAPIPAGVSVYLTPSAQTLLPNTTFSVAVRVDTKGAQANAAQAYISFPTNLVQVLSIDAAGSAFGIEAENIIEAGRIRSARGNIGNVSGDLLLVTLNLRSLTAAGTANLIIISSNSAVMRASDAVNILQNVGNGAYTISGSTAPDTTAPTISGVSASNISSTTARINWTTNEAADSLVEFGLSASYGLSSSTDTTLVTSHVTNLTGLTPNTVYHYRVRSRDAAGNRSFSSNGTFTTSAAPTDTTPPVISLLGSGSITSTSAGIGWVTNEPADSLVEYGLTTAYGLSSSTDTTMSTGHAVTLTGLQPSTLYHYRVRSRDAAGNRTFSGDATFTTTGTGGGDTAAPAVNITSPVNSATVSGLVTISANATDNVGVAGVQFRVNNINLNAEDTTAPYSTTWNTAGLPAGNYLLTAVGRDAAGNTAIHSITVTVQAPPPSCQIRDYVTGKRYLRNRLLSVRVSIGNRTNPSGTLAVTFRGRAGTYQTVTARKVPNQNLFVATLDTMRMPTNEDELTIRADYSGDQTANTEMTIYAANSLTLDGQPENATKSTVFTVPDTNFGDEDATIRLPQSANVNQLGLQQVLSAAPAALGALAPGDTPITEITFSVPGRPNLIFNKPVPITLTYADDEDANSDGLMDGNGTEDTTGVSEKDLRVFSRQGTEWKLVGGKVDEQGNKVTAMVTSFSTFALMKGAGVSEAKAAQKFLSPVNADGINDHADFGLEAVEVEILDVNGRRVFTANTAERSDSAISWNCRDEQGRIVPSGVYIAKVKKADGGTVYQSLVVAK